jgi:hypothetical protein
MRNGLTFCSCLVLLLLSQTVGYAQNRVTAERELREALIQYREQLRDLAQTRRIGFGAVTRIPFDNGADSYLLRGAQPINYSDNLSRQQISEALNGYPQQTAVLFYSYQGNSLRIWLIDRTGIQAFHKSNFSRIKLNAAVTNLRGSLGVEALQLSRAPRLVGPSDKAAPKTFKLPLKRSINNLTRVLLPAPIAQKLLSVRHLIVAPVSSIGTVPFALLEPFGDGTDLIDKMSISVVPSVYDVMSRVEEWRADFRAPLVVGNPYFPPSPKWKVPPLPGAEEEALYVAKLIGAQALTGKRATKQEIVGEAKRADFLYFATHGIASSDNPLSGGLLMFSANEFEQGWWTAEEIQASELHARIVVLSACQTGLGKVHRAGIIGLSRAFQIAGVPRVAMSLWSIDDKATTELMRLFVAYLQQHTPSESLRLAMLDIKRRQNEPSKWASFVLFGTPR